MTILKGDQTSAIEEKGSRESSRNDKMERRGYEGGETVWKK
jgi:hypothetical protein